MSGEAQITPRVAPGTAREIGVINASIARVLGIAAGTTPPNIFTTLARHRGLFRRWLVFAGALMPGGRLPRADTEMLILRVAHLAGCEYEWSHHARLGAKAGLTAEEIANLRRKVDAGAWPARKAALLRAADELHAHRRIGDAAWAALAAHLDEREIIELCMLVGHYEMLAMTLNSLGVQPDKPR
jgi:AhpD family alkylhydroperoxidase